MKKVSIYPGNSAKFWLGLQNDYDLEEEYSRKKEDLESIRKFKDNVA